MSEPRPRTPPRTLGWGARPLVVDRCVCMDRTFAELRELAEREGLDERRLALRTGVCGAGGGCGTCTPYVRLTLRTGETVFPVLTPAEIEQAERPDR